MAKYKMVNQKDECLMFDAEIDEEGDFMVRISLDGEDWEDLFFIDSESGKLELMGFIESKFKKYIALDARNTIVLNK